MLVAIYSKPPDDVPLELPPEDAGWTKNNPKCWPRLVYEDLVDYMILKKAYDGKEMRAFRSLYGKNYVKSEWLSDVYDCKVGELHFFKAKVSPSQPGVGRAEYKSWAVVSDSNIVTGHCTCPAGAGRSCSHIAAVLYAVIMAWEYGIAGETCTDKMRLWGRGASKVLPCHEEFEDIVKENSTRKTKCDDKVSKPVLDHKDLNEFVNKCTVKSLWECKGSMLNTILTAPEREVKVKAPLQHGNHDIRNPESPAVPECTPCKDFFNKYVRLPLYKKTLLNRHLLCGWTVVRFELLLVKFIVYQRLHAQTLTSTLLVTFTTASKELLPLAMEINVNLLRGSGSRIQLDCLLREPELLSCVMNSTLPQVRMA